MEQVLKDQGLEKYIDKFKEAGYLRRGDIDLIEGDSDKEAFIVQNCKVTLDSNRFQYEKLYKFLSKERARYERVQERRADKQENDAEAEAVGERPRKRLKVENVCIFSVSIRKCALTAFCGIAFTSRYMLFLHHQDIQSQRT